MQFDRTAWQGPPVNIRLLSKLIHVCNQLAKKHFGYVANHSMSFQVDGRNCIIA